jgi:hypothetical protein
MPKEKLEREPIVHKSKRKIIFSSPPEGELSYNLALDHCQSI